MPISKYCATLTLGATLLLTACQSTGEQLSGLDGGAGELKPPEVSHLPSDSVFVTMETRKGVTQKFALITAEDPVANVLLFAGGNGVLNLKKSLRVTSHFTSEQRYNFLVRSKDQFIYRGLNAVLVDAPSDHLGINGMQRGFRNSARHVKDVEAIIDFVRQRTDLPVWLVGTSRGTESAAYVAIHSREQVDGVILTSPISVSNRNGTRIGSYDLEKIQVPVQILFHEKDGCNTTPPSGVRSIARSLANATKVEVKGFNGGGPAVMGPCTGRSEHGFLYIESSVIESMAAFIKAKY